MKKLIMTAIVSMLMCSSAVAEDWYLYVTSDKVWFFFNLDELQCDGNVCQTWDAGIYTNKFHDFQLARVVVDCHEGKTKSLGDFKYRKGKLDTTNTRESPWLYPPPNTIGREMVVTICNPQARNPDNYLNFASLFEAVPNVQKAMRHLEEQKR
ncbi:MAG: hypothetical protein IKC44_05425 [Burkholderiaceae bacterium]|nr:hypothetical protein [Burkholderiaceae bacterium]